MIIDHWLGLVTGVIFGFLMQKGRVVRFEKQIGALRLQDMTIVKFMLSAILVGMVGLTILSAGGLITLSHKALNLGGVLVGGVLFGAGWALAGFCPGTSLGALGEGRWHVFFVIVGMLVGAAIYAEIYPVVAKTLLAWQDLGKIGWPEAIGVSRWVVMPILCVLAICLFFWFEKKGL